MFKIYTYLLIYFIIVACNTSNQTIDSKTVFRYNEHANITTLDPAFAKDQRNIWACNLIYNGLVKLDQHLEVAPDLAHSWVITPDGLNYTFYLNDSIYFHSNLTTNSKSKLKLPESRTLTAYDVKYSLERLTDPELASNGSWIMQHVDHIKVIDNLTVRIKLKQAFPAFLGLLTMKYCSILMPEAVNYYGTDYRSNPVGTGPFYLKRWEENVKMVLRKHQKYHEKDTKGNALPYLEAVAITFKNDKQSELLEYTQGNLDFINAIDPSYKDELLTPSGDLTSQYQSSTRLIKSPFLNTEYLGIYLNDKKSILQNKLLRKAINMGFDRVKMIKYLRNNIGKPATHGFIPLGLAGGGIATGYTYQPLRAQQLVQDYITTTGNNNPKITLSTSANYVDLCEFIQKEIEQIGISTTIDVMPPSTLRQARSKGKLQVFRSSWIADYPDAQNYLSLGYSRNLSPNGSNYTHFKNDTYDQLYEQMMSISDLDQRIALYTKMDSILIDESPMIPLYYDQSVRFVSKKVKGMTTNALNTLDLTRVYKID